MGFRLKDYVCPECGNEQEELIWNDDLAFCSKCCAEMRRVPSVFGIVICKFLGRTKIGKGEQIDIVNGGAKQWNNS